MNGNATHIVTGDKHLLTLTGLQEYQNCQGDRVYRVVIASLDRIQKGKSHMVSIELD